LAKSELSEKIANGFPNNKMQKLVNLKYECQISIQNFAGVKTLTKGNSYSERRGISLF